MITDQLRRWARERPDVVALRTFGEGGALRLTYARLWERIAAAAALLRAAGIAPGDRVALFAGNGPEWAIAYLAIHATGAAVVPLDAQYGVPELKVLLDFAAPKAVIADAPRRAKIAEATAAPPWDLGSLRGGPPAAPGAPIAAGGATLVAAPPAPEFVPHAHEPEDLMSLIFTSGTTGDPKAVQLTCANIHANIEGVLRGIRITDEDNLLHILPLHHAYAATAGLLVPLSAGATVTFCASLKGPDLIAAMQATGVTVLPGVPQLFVLFDRGIFRKIDALPLLPRTLFWTLYAVARAVRRTTGLRAGRLFFRAIHRQFGPRFRLCASGGAKLDPAVAERFLNLGILMLEGYGLTETSPVISFTPYSRPRPGSVGRPLHNVEVRIDAPSAEDIGEICVRGPSVMRGYYLRDDATAEVIRDGWLHTGDLGFVDADGMIHITGRAKEVIVLASGKNIYPDDVEKHYESTVFVKEICIAPHEAEDGAIAGLRAIVVPDEAALAARKVANARERIRAEIAKTAAALPSYMRCTDVVLYAGEFPRTRLGKLKRAEIAAQLSRRAREGAAGEPGELPAETRALLEHPSAARFLARLAQTIAAKTPLHPAQDLEFDLGVDSLTQVQIAAVLEDEFGVAIPDEERAAARTVGDLLARVAAAGGAAGRAAEAGGGPGRYSWEARLSAPVDPPLEARFNLARGAAKRVLVRCVKTLAMLLACLAFRVRLKGAARLPREGPFLICPNHVSYLDPILIYTLFPMRVVHRLLFVAFGEIFRRAPLSWIVGFARLILTGGADTTEASLRLSYQGLRRGMHVCIFPEGARSTRPGEILEPRPGAGILAVEAGVPIVPVRIDGAERTLSTFRPGFRLCKIAIAVGEPIAPPARSAGDSQAAYQEVMRAWREAIARMAPAEKTRHV